MAKKDTVLETAIFGLPIDPTSGAGMDEVATIRSGLVALHADFTKRVRQVRASRELTSEGKTARLVKIARSFAPDLPGIE